MFTLSTQISAMLLLCTALFASVPLDFQAQSPPPQLLHLASYQLGYDIDFSPYAGSENLLFATRAIERIENAILGQNAICYSAQAGARLWRLSELFFGWLPLNYYAIVLQHEFFGHGFQIRSAGKHKAKVIGYEIDTPIPYGYGGGATEYAVSNRLTTTDESAISLAGINATAILALATKIKWLQANWIDPKQSILYLLGQYDLNLYVGSLDTDTTLNGHDVHDYIQALNYTYPAKPLNCQFIQNWSWINLIDPFTYYAIYSWFHYLSSGQETTIPMIPIANRGYLFNCRLQLTPFGPEYLFENYLLQNHQAFYFYLKGGKHGENNYYGGGFYAPSIWQFNGWAIGARLDGWKQPQLLLFPGNISAIDIDFHEPPNPHKPLYPYSEQYKSRLGAGGSIICSYGKDKSGFEFELGFKAQGFIAGYSLKASPIARFYYMILL